MSLVITLLLNHPVPVTYPFYGCQQNHRWSFALNISCRSFMKEYFKKPECHFFSLKGHFKKDLHCPMTTGCMAWAACGISEWFQLPIKGSICNYFYMCIHTLSLEIGRGEKMSSNIYWILRNLHIIIQYTSPELSFSKCTNVTAFCRKVET